LGPQSGDGLTLPGDDPLGFSDVLLRDRKLGFVGHQNPSRLRLALNADPPALVLWDLVFLDDPLDRCIAVRRGDREQYALGTLPAKPINGPTGLQDFPRLLHSRA
jgi:hypothetical protein